jgi:hypothetical protein
LQNIFLFDKLFLLFFFHFHLRPNLWTFVFFLSRNDFKTSRINFVFRQPLRNNEFASDEFFGD